MIFVTLVVILLLAVGLVMGVRHRQWGVSCFDQRGVGCDCGLCDCGFYCV